MALVADLRRLPVPAYGNRLEMGPLLPRDWAEGLLAFSFAVFFVFDVWKILRMREFQATVPGPRGELFPGWYAPIGVVALLGAGVIYCWSGKQVWPGR